MRALVICDKVEPRLYSPSIKERVGDIDLIISCGDLPFYYIEFIVSMLNKPCFFVFGNHGHVVEYQGEDWIKRTSPGGAQNLHVQTAKVGPLLLAGLEGSMRYNRAPHFQYTDGQMWANVIRLMPKLLWNRIRYGRWLDVLVAHSPPKGIHDKEDRAHQGFSSFLTFMRWFKPRYLLHGHIHLYRNNTITETQYDLTQVINVYPFRILELEPSEHKAKKREKNDA